MSHRPVRLVTSLVAAVALSCTVAAVPAAQAVTTTASTSAAAIEFSETAAHLGLPQGLWAGLSDADRARLTTFVPFVKDVRERAEGPEVVENHVRAAILTSIRAAIDPSDYECAPTPLNEYVDSLVQEFVDQDKLINLLFLVLMTNALNYPTYDALFEGSPGDSDYAVLPRHANPLNRGFWAAQKFWDVQSSDIQFMGMQGDMFADLDRVEDMAIYFGDGASLAPTIQDYVATSPRGYDNPLWTLNAFAFTAEGETDPEIAALPDKLVFGDGILVALNAVGLGDAGPQAVMGHEFGHHVQYEIGQPVGGSPEGTRRSELEADYLATYFVTHKRGLARNDRRVVESIVSFGSLGDCGFGDDGHHGTPNQRRKAAEAGALLARSAHRNGAILPSRTVVARFAEVLPTILLPDAK